MVLRTPRTLILAAALAASMAVGLATPVLARPTTGATCGTDTTTITWSAREHLGRITVLWLNQLGTSDPAGTLKQVEITARGSGSYTTDTADGSVLLGVWYFDRAGNFIGSQFFACG